MEYRIETINRGIGASNCYICSIGNRAFLIDPGCDIKYISDHVQKNKLDVVYILLTHGHFDHIYSLDEVRALFPEAITFAQEQESDSVTDSMMNGSFLRNKKNI